MPYSDPQNKPYTMELIDRLKPKTILDVGTGAGIYADLIRAQHGNSIHITGIEPWLPYYQRFNLLAKYDAMSCRDARFITHWGYDLVLFGDVLEHMSKDDALTMWVTAGATAKHMILSIPIIHYPQGEEEGNPYEKHVKDDWTVEEVLDSFGGITEYQVFPVTMVALS
jgi:hypothetical protein